MRVALDTNILVYAEGLNGAAMQKSALDLLDALPRDIVIIPAQIVGELLQVLVRKAKRTPTQAQASILAWCDGFTVAETSQHVLLGAAELAVTHHLSFWDGVVLVSAAEAGCRLLLSEDLHSGFTWSSVTVANPFATPTHPLLQNLLGS